MTAPTQSKIRVVRVYPGDAGPNQGLPSGPGALGRPNDVLAWPSKHPLDSDWWWVDATGLCNDLDDTIAQVGVLIVAGDSAVTALTFSPSMINWTNASQMNALERPRHD